MHIFKRYFGLIFLLLISYITVKPLLIPGYFPMHDDTQPTRVYEMATALKDGMFPVRWSENLGYGYGYPIFNFYAPLSYYFGGFINLFTDALTATKLIMGFAIVLAGITMYLLAREVWGEYGGVLSGLLYLYAPYHALDLYVRGDLAELFAYAFIPLVFHAVFKLWRYNSKFKIENSKDQVKSQKFLWIWISVGSLSYAAVITSHNLTAMMVTPFIIAVILIACCSIFINNVTIKQFNHFSSKVTYISKIVFPFFFALLIGIMLSAFYWFPALTEMKYTNVLAQIGGKADYNLHFVCPLQLWESLWGFGGSAPGCIDGMSFIIGKLHIILSIVSIIPIIFFWKKNKTIAVLTGICLFLFLVSIWLTTVYSAIVWNSIPLMKFFQYPWRLLLTATFFSSFLSGSIFPVIEQYFVRSTFKKYINLFSLIILLFVIILLYGKLFNPQTNTLKNVNSYISESAEKWEISKISDEYLPKVFKKPEYPIDIVKEKITILDGQADITIIDEKTQLLKGVLHANTPTRVIFKTAYFPAWTLYLNELKYSYTITPRGLEVAVPSGKTDFRLQFEQTTNEKFGNILSVIGIVVLVAGIMKVAYNNNLMRH